MDKLILKFKERIIKEYPITGNQIKIGRGADNDIIIDNSAISRHHAKIDVEDGNCIISDLNSTNGTFINENRIKERLKLKDGDKIIVGKHSIVFESENKLGDKADIEDFGGTVILNTEQQRELLAKQQKSPVSTFEEKTAKLIIAQSKERREHKLNKDVTVIGKSPASDVVLKGFLIPQMAATIKREGGSYYITGYGGWIKVNVNGRMIGKNWKLYPNDTIEIRNVKIIFQYK